MKRRTLDIMFSVGGIAIAGLLLIVGLVMAGNAGFSTTNVTDQLSREKIEFKAADKLTPKEIAYTEARTGCLFVYAGQKLVTGKQAECYANEYIGGHLTYLAERLGKTSIPEANGLSYRELGVLQGDLRAKIAAAQESSDPALAGLEQKVADVAEVRDEMFKGTMLRNALLTSYGFSVLGEKAAQAARIAYIAAAFLALLSIAGFVHAFATPESEAFAPVEVPRELERPARV